MASIPTDNEKYTTHAVLLGDAGRNRRNQCDQYATFPQHAPGTLPGFAADRVQYNIDVRQHFFERCGVVVNQIVSAQMATNAVSRTDAVASTRALRQRASCTAGDPTPLAPPGTRQSLTPVKTGTAANAVARDKIVYTSIERTGNICMLTE